MKRGTMSISSKLWLRMCLPLALLAVEPAMAQPPVNGGRPAMRAGAAGHRGGPGGRNAGAMPGSSVAGAMPAQAVANARPAMAMPRSMSPANTDSNLVPTGLVESSVAEALSSAVVSESGAVSAAMPQAVPAAPSVQVAQNLPLSVAAAGPTSKDPVYEAWEEFLKKRSENAPAANNSGDSKLSVVQSDMVAQGSLGAGPWGSLVATVFGGMTLAGVWFARKKGGARLTGWLNARNGNRERPRVKVMSVNALSSQGSIAVVEVAGQVLVLGVTAGRVSLLTRLGGNGGAAPVEPEDEQNDLAPASTTRARGRADGDFNSLLGNLMQEREVPVEPAMPSARYASMAGAPRRDADFEPPPEDMAGQVLRKMKTMRRFRGQA